MLESAGFNRQTGQGGSVVECMKFPDRPGTPPEIAKYRRSANLEPGRRYQHYGIADDLKTMNLDSKVFGDFSDPAQVTAADLINHKKPSNLERINLVKAEKVYKGITREPLGRGYDRGIVLPEKHTKGNVPFGCVGKSSLEPAKDIIFPQLTEDTTEGERLYTKSHGTWGVGQQVNRNYKWYVDPESTRFGRKGDTIALNGVSKNIYDVLKGVPENEPSIVNTKRVEDFRNTADMLGMSKNLGQGSGARPFEMVYGKPSASSRKAKGTWGAGEVIKGKYSIEEQMPDPDLGKSLTPGFRNISLEDRAYGCPSIRTDLPHASSTRRSLADSQNYGDDVPAQDLINPPAFSDLAIKPSAMSELRTKEKLQEVFRKIGFDVSDDIQVRDAIFDEASGGSSLASINSYRTALNKYLIAKEMGEESLWRREHGL